MTNRESFKHVQNWIAEVHSIVGSDVQIMVLGNKCDLAESRDIPNAEIQVGWVVIRNLSRRLESSFRR